MGVMQSDGNGGECRGITGTYGSGYKVPGECRGTPGERNGVGAKCQWYAGECQGNVWELVQSARGM